MRSFLTSSILSALCITSAVAAPHGNHRPSFGNGTTSRSRPDHPLSSGAVPSGAVPSGFPNHRPSGSDSAPHHNISHHEAGGKVHIVLFNQSHAADVQFETILNKIELHSNHTDVLHLWNNSAFQGFAARLKSHCIDKLNLMEEVAEVEESATISARDTTAQAGETWGLQRISSASTVGGDPQDLDYTYSYADAALGAGVDIYIVDTGIQVEHATFEGRVTNGFVYSDFNGNFTDGYGHGTHVAGTSAGKYFGVAEGANLIAVKVLGDDGAGSSQGVLAGIDWVLQQHEAKKSQDGFVGSIMNFSWSLPGINTAILTAISGATTSGIHVAAAAGNDGQIACDYTPSSAGGSSGSAVVVGAVDINDDIASFSNTGSCVDIYAPGDNVLSSWIGANDITVKFESGTSMATPHVTGVMAYLVAANGTLAQDPAAMKEYLRSTALSDVVSGDAGSGDPKLLLNNGVTNEGITGILKRSAKPNVEVSKPYMAGRFSSKKVTDPFRFTLSSDPSTGPW